MAARYIDVTIENQINAGLRQIFEGKIPPAIPHYDQLKPVVRVGKQRWNPGKLSFPKGVAIDANSNHIYVIENGNARVSVFTESGEFLNTFTHELMKRPWGIAINQDNVYVTAREVHGVFHFKIHAGIHFIARLTGKGSSDGMFNDPRQLTVSVNGEMYLDFRNHRIQILDDALNFERSITHKSMLYPVDVQLTNTEVYVISGNSPCIQVFSHDGEKIRSLITRGIGMQVSGTFFFCLDSQKNLLISDFGADCVKVLSPDGTLIHKIEGISYPLGLALTKQLKLVQIAPMESLQLKIYSC